MILALMYRWPFSPPDPVLARARPGPLFPGPCLAQPYILVGRAVLAHRLPQWPRHGPMGLFRAGLARDSPALQQRSGRPKPIGDGGEGERPTMEGWRRRRGAKARRRRRPAGRRRGGGGRQNRDEEEEAGATDPRRRHPAGAEPRRRRPAAAEPRRRPARRSRGDEERPATGAAFGAGRRGPAGRPESWRGAWGR